MHTIVQDAIMIDTATGIEYYATTDHGINIHDDTWENQRPDTNGGILTDDSLGMNERDNLCASQFQFKQLPIAYPIISDSDEHPIIIVQQREQLG